VVVASGAKVEEYIWSVCEFVSTSVGRSGVHERIFDVSGDSRRETDGGTGPRGDRRGEKVTPPSGRRCLWPRRRPDYRCHRTAQRFDATGSVVPACTHRGELAAVVRPTRTQPTPRATAAVSVEAASGSRTKRTFGDCHSLERCTHLY
jgi:hypothetical protein